MAPIAKRQKKVLQIGSNKKTDYYYWLRDDQRKDKEVLKYLEEENNYTTEQMMKRNMLIEKTRILKNLKNHLVENWETVRLPKGCEGWKSDYYFYKKYEKGLAHPIYMYEKNGKSVAYCNPNSMQIKGKMLAISTPIFNEDLTMIGWGTDYSGSEKYDIKLYKFPEMSPINHDLPKLLYSEFLLWGNKVFYGVEDESNRMFKIMEYVIGGESEVLYEIEEKERSIYFDIGSDFRTLFFGWKTSDECEFNSYNLESGEKKLVRKAKKKVMYDVDIWNSQIVLVGDFTKKGANIIFQDEFLLEEDADLYVDNWKIIKDGVILLCRKNGQQFFKSINLTNKQQKDWHPYEGGFTLNLHYANFQSNEVVMGYEDLITPEAIWRLNVNNWEREFLYEEKTFGYKKAKYTTKREWVKSKNVDVPLDIIKKEGNKKVLLYGYGCYGANIDCEFDWKRFCLIDDGYDYAIAHVRGSAYMGKKWYKHGKMKKKLNSFYDFNAAAQFLNNQGYEVSCEGRSAGGLLVAASSVLQPQLYKNVLAIVPFVDVITTMSDESIPLTTGEWLEIGNPNLKTYWDYIKRYSPMDNINPNLCYPNYYVLGGLHDPRVAYWEPAKFVANLRYNSKKDCDNVVLLRIEMGGGHFMAEDRYKMLDQLAERYAFLLKN